MKMYLSSIKIESYTETSILDDFRPETVENDDFLRVMSGWI